MPFTTSAEFDDAFDTVKATFARGATRGLEWRRRQLQQAWWMIEDNKDVICEALHQDLHKHPFESRMSDCGAIQNDILHTLDHLVEWTKDTRPARTNALNFLGGVTVRKEPLGVTLIIGSWNYPFLLLFQPMVAAIAAGCAIVLKPSDVPKACEELIMQMVPKYLDSSAIRCVSAGPQEMGYILQHRFDHIFYTGSASVAKIIHAAAAKHLTPVTLELGGQGPAIVCKSANIDLAAKRIAATKFLNAGQICLNVNHILVDPSVRDALVARLTHYFEVFMGGNAGKQPAYYTSIINERHFDRLDNLLQQTQGRILYGGERHRDSRFFAPTIVSVKPDDCLLADELFGPILPVLDADLDTALNITASGEHPLAVYVFTSKASDKGRVLNGCLSGGVTFNDCMLHAAAVDAPFGGVGSSGMGYYHGSHGVDAFSHLRTCMDGPPAWMEGLMTARYPPYSLGNEDKLLPTIRPTFDRNGRPKSSGLSLFKWGIGLAALGSMTYVIGAQQGVLPQGINFDL